MNLTDEIMQHRIEKGKSLLSLNAMRMLLIAVCCAVCSTVMAASPVKTLKGKATYYAEPDESKSEAQAKAREMAIYDAIRDEFGTIMSHTVVQEDISDESGEMTRLYSNSAFELKGEWISDVRTAYDVAYRNDALVVTCECEFKAREVTNEAPAIDCGLLTAPDLRSPGTDFKSGDNMYASFCCPGSDGYLVVCLADEAGTVSRLLPGRSSSNPTLEITKGYDYVLFDRNRVSPDGTRMLPVKLSVAEGKKMEVNTVYFIFSPRPFSDGPWHRGATRFDLPSMSVGEFNTWLQQMAARDPSMAHKAVRVKIRPKPANGVEEIKY